MRKTQPLWRSTPPAIFPIALGFMGLGLAWRNVANVVPVPSFLGELILGVSAALFVFFAVSYLLKFIARPAVVLEDMKTPPGRAGVAAISMGLMILAAAMLPFGALANGIWWAGVILQVVVILLVTRVLMKMPPEARMVTPFQLLPYVGLIVAPIAGVALGHSLVVTIVSVFSFLAFLVIAITYGLKLTKVRPQQPLRPSLVIFLAPMSLFAITAALTGHDIIFTVFYWLAVDLAVVFLVISPWLTKGGWTPIWGALTFPVATFTSLQAIAVGRGGDTTVALTLMIAGLVIATGLILYVVYMAGKAWIRGDLSKKTGAATA